MKSLLVKESSGPQFKDNKKSFDIDVGITYIAKADEHFNRKSSTIIVVQLLISITIMQIN